MPFLQPIAFSEALKSSKVKKLLPTSAGSAELSKLDAQIRERARFMARVNHVGTIATLDQGITALLDPLSGRVQDASQLRLQMKQQLAAIGYDPENPPEGFEPAKPGSLQDISSDARLNLAIDTNIRMAHGYARSVKANDPDIIDDWPCWEFVRDQQRKVPRDQVDPGHWLSRWVRAGGKVYGRNKNRLIARKDDPVWSNTIFSVFGQPYPPFDYGSGMGVEEVSRSEAEELGVIKPSTIVMPEQRSFNNGVQAAVPSDLSPSLLSAVQKAFGAAMQIKDGMFILEGAV